MCLSRFRSIFILATATFCACAVSPLDTGEDSTETSGTSGETTDPGTESGESTSEGDSGSETTGGQPGAEVGEVCDLDLDCASETCTLFGEMGLCTVPCDDGCPGGTTCFENLCLPEEFCFDEDEDGFGQGPACFAGDCDDEEAEINPGHPEVCDGLDANCDRRAEDGLGDTETDALQPAIMSIELLGPDEQLFVAPGYTVEETLTDLLRLVRQVELDAVGANLSAAFSDAFPPGFIEGDVCALETELEYLTTNFVTQNEPFAPEMSVGEKCFLDEFAFTFCTLEPEEFTPLPTDDVFPMVLFVGDQTPLGTADEALHVVLNSRNRRFDISLRTSETPL